MGSKTKVYQLMMWDSPESMVVTVNGEMPYGDWLQNEKERIESDPTRFCEIRSDGNRIALFANVPEGYIGKPEMLLPASIVE